jgi:hypothetical protein
MYAKLTIQLKPFHQRHTSTKTCRKTDNPAQTVPPVAHSAQSMYVKLTTQLNPFHRWHTSARRCRRTDDPTQTVPPPERFNQNMPQN